MLEAILQYEYLVGGLILGALWIFIVFIRRDLLKVMLWSSVGYFGLFLVGFAVLPILNQFISPEMAFNPGYWAPDSLWDLNRKTGGAGIEDGVFMFFLGGIASALYELTFRKKVGQPRRVARHFYAIKIGIFAMIACVALFKLNLIWPLIIFGFVTAFVEVFERRDLFGHVLWGGLTFLGVYLLAFGIFNLIYPDFIETTYNLSNLSGIMLWGFPAEEILYALSFGMMWAPLYEYVTGARDANLRVAKN